MGQNFLISEYALAKLVSSAEVKKTDVVLEVGAGIGTITLPLAELAKNIIAVEKDKALIPILEETVMGYKNVEIVQGDILKLPYNLKPITYNLLGNIPYYLTSPLIRKFLESTNPPSSMTLMVQKEMAQRICASPPDMSILAVSVQVYAKPEIIEHISRSAFWPMPAVDSAILRITQISTDANTDMHKFFKFVKAGFSSPRKQLINNLSKGLDMGREQTQQWLRSCAIDPKRRAETLTIGEWAYLTKLSP